MNQFADNALILVSILPNPKDLEIARLFGWYRIPLRMAPKIIDVDYLAFYQTSQFGDTHKWKIEYFAQVLGYELTTRNALLREETNHPRANEEYYKIQIGPLQLMEKPLLAGNWKRITFLYTLGSLVNRAETINDLSVRSEDRDILWRTLRERNTPGYGIKGEADSLNLSDEDVFSLLADLTLIHSHKEESQTDFKDQNW